MRSRSISRLWGVALASWALAVAVPPVAVATSRVSVTLTTADLRRALSAMPSLAFGRRGGPGPVIGVDAAVRYQQMTGFGAAMTDSSAWLIEQALSPAARAALMEDLFGRRGLALDFVRVPIGASDFTATGTPYSYDDLPVGAVDPDLGGFSIAHDEPYLIPALRQMLAIDPDVRILANPWSPPAWMKANGGLDDLAGAGTLRPRFYRTLAEYFVRFIEAYQDAGIPIWAITPENEPIALSPYPGMYLSAADEARLIAGDMAPALAQAGLHSQIYGLDLGGSYALPYAQALLASPAAGELAGLAWHCYGGLAPMAALHQEDPGLPLIVSECSPGIISYPIPEVAIAAARDWAGAVALWNLALDPSGGPVQGDNTGCPNCTGLVTIDQGSGAVRFGPTYFQFGQISRFVQPGAHRIASDRPVREFVAPSGAYGVTPGLDDVAFQNPDGTIVLVVYDNSRSSRPFSVRWHGRYLGYRLAPGATVTFTWR